MNHSFDCEVAAKYGLLEAILINNFQHWIKLNRDNKRNFQDGRTWTYNSVKSFHKQYFYVSADKIRRALDKLVGETIIIKGVYNERPGDRTTWYAFTDENYWVPEPDHLASVPSGRGDSAKSPIGTGAKSTNKTDIDTNTNTNKNIGPRATRLSPDWMPSDADAAFLQTKRPDLSLADVADNFRDYWIAKPDDAKKLDWSATWRTWVRRQSQGQGPAQRNAKPTAYQQKHDQRQALINRIQGKSDANRTIDIN